MPTKILRDSTYLLLALLIAAPVSASAQSPTLLKNLNQRVEHWQTHLKPLNQSASQAASGAVKGGRIFAVGPQPGFATEARGRAGGLMMIKGGLAGDTDLSANDTILAALGGGENQEALRSFKQLVDRAAKAGAHVIVFADGQKPALSARDHLTLLSTGPDQTPDPAVRALSNVIGMWAWTGAFIDACVGDGSMPCVYQSHLLPGGRDRTKMLTRRFDGRFHKNTHVRPEDAAGLGKRYLQTVGTALKAVMKGQSDQLRHAAKLLDKTHDQGHGVQVFAHGHLYPEMVQNPSMPDGWTASRKASTLQPHQAAVILEYQAFPWPLVEKITAGPRVCIVTSSQRALPVFTDSPNHVYINPHWPIHDGAVALQGYDVPVLPTSGVMDSAVYWQLVRMTQGQ